MKEVKSKHDELCNTAIGWLYGRGCQVFAQEVPTWNGIADAVGVKDNDVYYIEAKASRSDLKCKKQQCCYRRTELIEQYINQTKGPFYQNDVDFFYFIVADGVKFEDTLYPDWGIINESGIVVRKAKRMYKVADNKGMLKSIGHVLVYKVFGKLYLEGSK